VKQTFKILSLLALLSGLGFIGACSSGPKPEVNSEDAINDALISFTYSAQGGRYSDALECLTYDDQLKIIDGNGNIKEEYRVAMTRVKLSSLQRMPFTLDFKGRLEGMVAVLDDANRKFTMSQQQRSTSLEQVEKNRVINKPVVEPVAVSSSSAGLNGVSDSVPVDDKPLTVDEFLK